MPDATFTTPDLTTFTGPDDLDLIVIGQRLEPHRAVLDCRVLEPDDWCHHCGCQGRPIGTVIRRLAHAPFGWRPTTLHHLAPPRPPLPLHRLRPDLAPKHQSDC